MELNNQKILVADDSNFMQRQIQKALISIGFHNLIFASNGKEAIDLFFKEKPFLVIMDIKMPQIDGVEATKQIIARVPNAKIVVYSAEENQNILMNGIHEGALEFLIKPLSADKFKLLFKRFEKA